MRLFELDSEYRLSFNPELFLIECFEKLRDSRKKKVGLLYKEIGFIYFYCDMRSDFQFQTNKKKREEDVKKYLGLPEKWQPDDILKECMKTYDYLSQTVSSSLLQTTYVMADKIKTQMEDIDLNERDKSGKPVWDIKKMADTSKGMPALIESIQQAEKAFIKGQAENDKLRGDKVKTLYEDGFGKR